MIAVLSVYRPRLEDYLAERGEKFVAVVPTSRRCESERGYPVRTVRSWDYYPELVKLAGDLETMGVTAVTTIDEGCVRAAGFLRDLLGLPGQTHSSAVACTDKSVMKRYLGAAGVPVAEHRVVRSAPELRGFLDAVGGDIVVKPRNGFGGVNTHWVSKHNLDALLRANAFCPPDDLSECFRATGVVANMERSGFVAERAVDIAAEYHCELLRHDGAEVHCIAARYRRPMLAHDMRGSVLLDRDSVEARTVRDLTRAAASALGVTHGFGHCEIFRDQSGRWLVGEFASRPGGLVIPRMLQRAYGIDNLALLTDQLMDRRPPSAELARRGGFIAWRSLPPESEGVSVGQLLAMPGVIEVRTGARVTRGDFDAIAGERYVMCWGQTPQVAEESADRAWSVCGRLDAA